MKLERDKIKQRMIDIKRIIDNKIDFMDITGGQTGQRNNAREWNKIKTLKKELMILNRKLIK